MHWIEDRIQQQVSLICDFFGRDRSKLDLFCFFKKIIKNAAPTCSSSCSSSGWQVAAVPDDALAAIGSLGSSHAVNLVTLWCLIPVSENWGTRPQSQKAKLNLCVYFSVTSLYTTFNFSLYLKNIPWTARFPVSHRIPCIGGGLNPTTALWGNISCILCTLPSALTE